MWLRADVGDEADWGTESHVFRFSGKRENGKSKAGLARSRSSPQHRVSLWPSSRTNDPFVLCTFKIWLQLGHGC
jgi:hypothetical protein